MKYLVQAVHYLDLHVSALAAEWIEILEYEKNLVKTGGSPPSRRSGLKSFPLHISLTKSAVSALAAEWIEISRAAIQPLRLLRLRPRGGVD